MKKRIISLMILALTVSMVNVPNISNTVEVQAATEVEGEESNEVVNFQDENVEKAVRSNINKETGSLTVKDLEKVRSCYVRGDVTSFGGLQYCKNLMSLSAEEVLTSDFSPISELKEMSDITFSKVNTIKNLEFLKNFTKLSRLDIKADNLETVDGVQALQKLSKLNLEADKLQDLSAFESVTNVYNLNLKSKGLRSLNGIQNFRLSEAKLDVDNIEDVTCFKNFRRIMFFEFKSDNLKSIEGFQYLTSLMTLDLSVNSVEDLSPLGELKQLSGLTLEGKKINNLEGLTGLKGLMSCSLKKVNTTDFSPLEKLENIMIFTISDNDNINALKYLPNVQYLFINDGVDSLKGIENSCKNLVHLYISATELTDLTPIESLTNMTRLSICGNDNITDLSPISKLVNLEDIDISEMNLENLVEFTNMPKLETLRINDCNLSKVPAIENAPSLNTLYLNGNKLTNLDGIENYTSVKNLYLNNNDINNIDGLFKLADNIKDQNKKVYVNLRDTLISNEKDKENIDKLNELGIVISCN